MKNYLLLLSTLFFLLPNLPLNAQTDFSGLWEGKIIISTANSNIVMSLKRQVGSQTHYSGYVTYESKGGWLSGNATELKIFAKKESATKLITAYVVNGIMLHVKEIAIISKTTEFDWILNTYVLKIISDEKGGKKLESIGNPFHPFTNGEIQLKQTSNSPKPENSHAYDKKLPFTITEIIYSNSKGGSKILNNDKGVLKLNLQHHFGVFDQGTLQLQIKPSQNADHFCFSRNDGRTLLSNPLALIEGNNAIEVPLSSLYFTESETARFEISLLNTTKDGADIFFLGSNFFEVGTEPFFYPLSRNSNPPDTLERYKALSFEIGKQNGPLENQLKKLDELVTKGDKKAKAWRGLFYLQGKGGSNLDEKMGLDYIKSVLPYLESEARNQDKEAMYLLFYCYQFRVADKAAIDFSPILLQKSVDAGFSPALYDYTLICLNNKKYELGFLSAQKAYEQGMIKAAPLLGYLYENGLGVKMDVKQALSWYQKGINGGSSDAMIAMAEIYNKGKLVEPDAQKSLQFANQAIAKGNARAMLFLGNVYLSGNQGIPKDGIKAMGLFKKAAEAGDKDGMFSLGILLEGGKDAGITPDKNRAFFWIKKAAEEGHKNAMAVLSKYYEDGKVTEKSKILSRYWFWQSGTTRKKQDSPSSETDMDNFWNSADFSSKYYVYEDGYGNREVVNTGPDIIGGFMSGILGSYSQSRNVYQDPINGMELVMEKNNKEIYGGTISTEFTSNLKLIKGQVLKIRCSGALKLGYMLSGVSPFGVNGYADYSITRNIPHGAFMIKIGEGDWIKAGAEATINVMETGILQLAINDNDNSNNTGYFDFTIELDNLSSEANLQNDRIINKSVKGNEEDVFAKAEKPTAAMLRGFWRNTNSSTPGIPKLIIRDNSDHITVQAWGRCHPTDCEWGAAITTLTDLMDDGILKLEWASSFAINSAELYLLNNGHIRLKIATRYVDRSRGDHAHTYYFSRQGITP